tara:strand:- start:2419 stop:3036 length:618 start_codon:yes stop_codon:yes gene_type:complete
MTDTKREIERKMRENFDSLKRDEFMSLSEYLVSPIAVRDLQKKAFGGRIGFQDGRRVQPVEIPGPAQEMEMLMKRLMEEGLSREAAEREAELILFGSGPSAMKLKDSKRGLGSMMASADDEVKDPSDMLTDDAMDMLQTDPFELLKEAIEKGTIAELPDSDIYSMYDAAVERGAFDGTFEEFKAMLSQLQRRRRGPEGIMQTMVT